MRHTTIVLLIFASFLLSGCGLFGGNDTAVPAETADANATEEISATEEPAATQDVATTAEPAETPEVIDIENPLPSNANGYYVAPAYSTIEEGLNVTELPEGHYWVMATVTLANEAGDPVEVNAVDISLIGTDGERYETAEMVERVSPALVGTSLNASESVYGFALFALPEGIEPALFEWCPGATCDVPLQAPISLQGQ